MLDSQLTVNNKQVATPIETIFLLNSFALRSWLTDLQVRLLT